MTSLLYTTISLQLVALVLVAFWVAGPHRPTALLWAEASAGGYGVDVLTPAAMVKRSLVLWACLFFGMGAGAWYYGQGALTTRIALWATAVALVNLMRLQFVRVSPRVKAGLLVAAQMLAMASMGWVFRV